MPKSGVYLVRGRFIGHHAFGMCNFGLRPTFGESKLVMEIHFFHDSKHDLYGKEIRVEFLERIRTSTTQERLLLLYLHQIAITGL